MALTHLLLIFVVTFIRPLNSNTVSSDKIQSITVQEGHSLQLAVQEHLNEEEFDDLEWLQENSERPIVVSYNFKTKSGEIYRERVYFNTETYSLTLKNAQEADGGVYKARASGDSDIIIGQYNVTVGTRSQGSTTRSVSLTWIIFLFFLAVMMI